MQVDKKDPEVASQGSEKKDAEKNEGDEKKEGEAPEICKRIGRAKDECVLQFNQVRFTSDKYIAKIHPKNITITSKD